MFSCVDSLLIGPFFTVYLSFFHEKKKPKNLMLIILCVSEKDQVSAGNQLTTPETSNTILLSELALTSFTSV